MGIAAGEEGLLLSPSSSSSRPSRLSPPPPPHLHLCAGALNAAGLQRLLEGLGLDPTRRSLAALLRELAAPRTGGWAWWAAAVYQLAALLPGMDGRRSRLPTHLPTPHPRSHSTHL